MLYYPRFSAKPNGRSKTRTANTKNNLRLAQSAGPSRASLTRLCEAFSIHEVKDMNRKQTTAGRTAAKTNGGAQGAANGNGTWRKATRKGERVLIDPDGHIYNGTAQEVRDAAMTPHRRGALAQEIEWARHTADLFGYTPEQTAEAVREKRRDALRRNDGDAVDAYHAHIKQELAIVAEAAARYMGQTVEEFIADAVDAAVRGTIDVAELDAGKPGSGLPLTRHERAALDRIKRDKARILAEQRRRRAEFDAAQAAKIAKREARATA